MTPEPAEHQTRSVEQFHLDGPNTKAKDGTGPGYAIDVAGLERPETVNHFSVAANVRSIRSTLRSSTRSSPSNPPRAFRLHSPRALARRPCPGYEGGAANRLAWLWSGSSATTKGRALERRSSETMTCGRGRWS